MRGKAGHGKGQCGEQGITPACAGKSSCGSFPKRGAQDHPRVCGEKVSVELSPSTYEGSPPRVRGKGRQRSGLLAGPGITPAYAGKSVKQRIEACLSVGSPPHVRGKVMKSIKTSSGTRITPAYAGKSSIQHLTASLGEFEVQKGHPVPHLRQRLQVWPDHARHLRHGLILHASRSAGQGRRLCPGPCPDTADSGTPRGPSPAKRPHTSPPAATPGGCRAWQSGATAPGSQ